MQKIVSILSGFELSFVPAGRWRLAGGKSRRDAATGIKATVERALEGRRRFPRPAGAQ